MWKKLVVGSLLAITQLGCAGGWGVKPSTEFSFGNAHFYDSKDNNVELEGLEVDIPNKKGKIDKLTISNKASDVMLANVQQMAMYNAQMEIHGRNIQMALNALLPIAGLFAPALLPGLANNSGAWPVTPPGWVTNPSTTQPGAVDWNIRAQQSIWNQCAADPSCGGDITKIYELYQKVIAGLGK